MPIFKGGGESGYVREQLGHLNGRLDGMSEAMRRTADSVERLEQAVGEKFEDVKHRNANLRQTVQDLHHTWERKFASFQATADERHRDNLEAQVAMKADIGRLERPVHQFVRQRDRKAGMIMVLGALGMIATTLAGLVKPAWEAISTHLLTRWFGG